MLRLTSVVTNSMSKLYFARLSVDEHVGDVYRVPVACATSWESLHQAAGQFHRVDVSAGVHSWTC